MVPAIPPHDDNDPRPGGVPPELEQLLRGVLGPAADEVIEAISSGAVDLERMTGPDGRPLDLEALSRAMNLPQDPGAIASMIGHLRSLLDTGGEAVNWDLAHDVARRSAAAEGDPTVAAPEARQVSDALAVADLWLDQVTDLPATGGPAHAWSRAEWVEHTAARWRSLTQPVATSVAAALGDVMSRRLGELGELGDLPAGIPGLPAGADLGAMMARLSGLAFGMQVGTAAGTLAREVLGTTDIGLPLTDGPGSALLPRNVAEFGAGLSVPPEEVRYYVALREVAHQRLFTHVTWLRAHLLGAVEEYARGIEIDLGSLEEAVSGIDPSDPEALQEALASGVFAPSTTPAQEAALERLETALALVEGWVDVVTAAAAAPHLPHTEALRETMRRRRAAGGPAEDTFAQLVGLELRPRRSREAARLWELITEERGADGRERVWEHPDLLPTAADLDDPSGWSGRLTSEAEAHEDLDRVLAEILDGEEGPGSGGPEPDGRGPQA